MLPSSAAAPPSLTRTQVKVNLRAPAQSSLQCVGVRSDQGLLSAHSLGRRIVLHDDVLTCHNAVAGRPGIAQHVFLAVRSVMTLVAIDFNTRWRRTVGVDQHYNSTLEDAIKKWQTPCATQQHLPRMTDVCGFG